MIINIKNNKFRNPPSGNQLIKEKTEKNINGIIIAAIVIALIIVGAVYAWQILRTKMPPANKPNFNNQPICKDLCGDGSCQKIVCQALGCPCAETSASCPKDCP